MWPNGYDDFIGFLLRSLNTFRGGRKAMATRCRCKCDVDELVCSRRDVIKFIVAFSLSLLSLLSLLFFNLLALSFVFKSVAVGYGRLSSHYFVTTDSRRSLNRNHLISI